MTALAPTLQAFFTERLALQRQASGYTIAAYRDAIKMLIVFSAGQAGKTPSRLDITDLDAPVIGAFLNHLENDRGNSVRTRNARLAAIHSLFQYAALRHPEHAADIQRVLTISPKRYNKALITFLTEEEITALLAAPDLATWTGRRDQALLMLACQTGLRATELTSLTISDVHLGAGAPVSYLGKGRKQRITPLTPATVTVLRAWLAERGGQPADPLFITRRGTPLSRDALERRIAKYTATAAESCPALREKKVSPHVLRHSAAMRLLNAGVDTSVIALWMGHENTATTQVYIHADLALKERTIARTAPQNTTHGRHQPPDDVLAFLDEL
ncbi:site-specific integrase [Nonomuraea sp. NBC_00507]|uniref:tyrosine-type recombinase/integrase n=1 Tax=Nonomuraea sp. NBC_00507 TaxID=2976002 RepID=UPI002E18B43D